MGINYERILSRTTVWRERPLDPSAYRTWLSEIDTSNPCALCGKDLPQEAIREHLCCTCGDGGFLRAEGKTEPCLCRLTGIPEQEFLRRSGIPATMKDYALSSWGPVPNGVLEYAAGLPTPQKSLLFLTGTVGTGKSGLAVGVLRALWLGHSKVGRFVSAPELIRRFQASFAEDAIESKEDIHHEMSLAPLIVLDDYGTEKNTEFAQSEIYRLVSERHGNGKPLIVTTNCTLQEMDDRISSRLLDRERSTWIEFKGADRRAK